MDANEKLNRLVLYMFRQNTDEAVGDPDAVTHLVACAGARAVDAEGRNGTYGCDTGCEYATLEASITCLHGHRVRFEYGEFGDMAMLFDQMDRDHGR